MCEFDQIGGFGGLRRKVGSACGGQIDRRKLVK
jgi:hypothetical protein